MTQPAEASAEPRILFPSRVTALFNASVST